MASPWNTCRGRCDYGKKPRSSSMGSSWCRPRPVSGSRSISRRSSVTRLAEPELPREAAERLLLGCSQRGERGRDRAHVAGEDLRDESPPLGREVHRHVASIVVSPLAPHEAPPLEVVDDGRDVAAAAQQLGAERALTQGPEMQQGLEDTE